MTDITWLRPLIIAFAMATINTLLGYVRNTPLEEFRLSKFLGTLLIGIIIGCLTTGLGWTYATAEEWLASSGLTVWLYWIAKLIVVRLELPEKLSDLLKLLSKS